jgi:hypothetical protein
MRTDGGAGTDDNAATSGPAQRAHPQSSDVKALRGRHVARLDAEMNRFSLWAITLRCYRAVILLGVALIVAGTF